MNRDRIAARVRCLDGGAFPREVAAVNLLLINHAQSNDASPTLAAPIMPDREVAMRTAAVRSHPRTASAPADARSRTPRYRC